MLDVLLTGNLDSPGAEYGRAADEIGARDAEGVEVEVREKHPFDGPLVLRVGGQDRTVGDRVARPIFVRMHAGEAAEAAPLQERREQSP